MSNFFVQAFNRHAKQIEGKKLIKFLGVFEGNEPIVFWIKTEDTDWFRFFVDGIMLRWYAFEHIDRDDLKGDTTKVVNLTNKYNLQAIEVSEMKYDQKIIDDVQYGELIMRFENGISFVIQDFKDEVSKGTFEVVS